MNLKFYTSVARYSLFGYENNLFILNITAEYILQRNIS